MVLHRPAAGGMRSLSILILALLLAACGDTRTMHTPRASRTSSRGTAVNPQPIAASIDPSPQALVSTETDNRFVVVALASGRVISRVAVAPDSENLGAIGRGGVVVAVSARAGTVTLLDRASLRVLKVLSGFGSPHITEISPDGQYAYVTDDARGQVATIRLADGRLTARVFAGAGAHHLSFSPDERSVWVALGESARTIAILTTVAAATAPPAGTVIDLGYPRVIGRFDPGFVAHDLLFTRDGRAVWITSATATSIGVFDARDHHLLFRVPGGPPPQHVVFTGRFAYVSSGYGSTIEQVALATGRVLRRVRAPYGSFELDAADGYVATSSLLRGTLAVYNPQLELLRVVKLAPAARDVVISAP
jgi:hypothetical protein